MRYWVKTLVLAISFFLIQSNPAYAHERWFADQDGRPLTDQVSNYPELSDALPGTSIWHLGYDRGDWAKTAVGTHQNTPFQEC